LGSGPLGLREGWVWTPQSGTSYIERTSVFFPPQLHFDPAACSFRELLLEDGYNVYHSEALGLPLRLPLRLPPHSSAPQDAAPRGPARFLPLPGLPHAPPEPPEILAPEPPDVGSSDPLSMVGPLQGRSPSYAS
jgi:syndecan 4